MDFGTAHAEYGNSASQQKNYDRALKIAASAYGEDSRRYAELLTQAGSNILTHAHTSSARKYLERGYDSILAIAGPADPGTGYAAFWLAKYKMSNRRFKEAEVYLSAALATFANPDEPQNQMELTTHAFLVEVYEELGKSDRATQHCQAIGRMTPQSADQDYLPLYKRAPKYPFNAQQAGKSGSVIVRFTVDEEGVVREPEVIEVEGTDLFRNAAVDAVSRFRYAPRFSDGQPVATPGVLHRISFEIE
jgi:TonB family protein